MLSALPLGKKLVQKHREMLNLSRDFAEGGACESQTSDGPWFPGGRTCARPVRNECQKFDNKVSIDFLPLCFKSYFGERCGEILKKAT